ncbi:hypothetical protein HPP92_010825 [Vanilla planifolia]|uniref:Dynamin-related protein 4C-like n=1 Tax=Vanilla planifolia TaxID=51239 RepID=A0A835V4F9_VANPL|nr:hypothetical protein HPP92_011085 [Vanilla planifolia]KAG0482741.1 hypothetical protein HPP92_010825 [Vanilla planifolia]
MPLKGSNSEIAKRKSCGNHSNALTSSYDDHIRPLLDAVDRLRHLRVMEEGINLPTIVVVGDQSSGKSSVLESLAGISLPRGQGICTRVPLIMRLQDDPSISDPVIYLEYKEKRVLTVESDIDAAINTATIELAGPGKAISNYPLTLVIRKKGVPDLTMVDLPGITRVPVQGQPDNIYELIADIIKQYIKPQESIILNVLSASVDFSTCESIRMSQQVDRNGERTLAVVTKADKSPEGLLEKVTADDVNIGLGYICVRNRLKRETYEEARLAEAELFKSHPLLSSIDKSIVGIPVLAQRLVQIQAQLIAKCLPDIVRKINAKLNRNVSELDDMPQNMRSMGDAMVAFMQILSRTRETLRKLLIRGEYDGFEEDAVMHGVARLAEMLNQCKNEFPHTPPIKGAFLMEEIGALEEASGIYLSNFMPRTPFLSLLQKKIKQVSCTPKDFVQKVWDFVEGIVCRILDKESENYPPLQLSLRRAGQSLIEKMRRRSLQFVKEIVEMEMCVDYTTNTEYIKKWTNLMEQQGNFMHVLMAQSAPAVMKFPDLGDVDIGPLRQQNAGRVEQAFDMKMRLLAYWECVVLRLVDALALHVVHAVKNLVENELDAEIMNEVVGQRVGGGSNGIEKMLEESPATAAKRERLRKSISLLQESKDVVAKIMDRISIRAD